MVAQSSGQAAPQQLLPASEVQQITDIVGVDISAAAVAKILAEPQLQVDVPTALKAAQLDGLGFHLQPEYCVWRLLESENKAATKAVRTAFSYVDLTSKPFLPLWLPQDTIGGKHMMGSDWAFLDPTTTTGTLQQLGAALKAVSSSPRFFRSFPQWLAAFFKYAVVAVGTKQLTWPQVLSYVNVVCELQEKQRAESGNPFLAMLYDDVLRKQISHRAEQKDPTLDINKCFQSIDKSVLEACKLRLDAVLAQVGIQTSDLSAQHGGQSPNRARDSSGSVADSLSAKTSAASEAMQRKVDGLQKSVHRTQEQMQSMQRNSQGNHSQTAPGPWGPQHGDYRSPRAEQRSAWVQGKRDGGKGKVYHGGKGYGKGKGHKNK